MRSFDKEKVTTKFHDFSILYSKWIESCVQLCFVTIVPYYLFYLFRNCSYFVFYLILVTPWLSLFPLMSDIYLHLVKLAIYLSKWIILELSSLNGKKLISLSLFSIFSHHWLLEMRKLFTFIDIYFLFIFFRFREWKVSSFIRQNRKITFIGVNTVGD